MFVAFNKRFFFVTMIFTITVNLKLAECGGTKEGIEDICKIRIDSYSDDKLNTSAILQTYEVCLQTLQRYRGANKEQLLTQLVDRLECFREDLKQSFYAGNTRYEEIETIESLMKELRTDGTNVSSASWESAADRCNLARLTRSTVSRIIPLAVTGTLSQRKKACDTIFKKDKGFNISQVDDIPIPQLDNETNPKQLILPLNAPNTTTYMVNSPEAEHALTQYYKVVMKCLTLTTEHKIEVFKFNRRFYDWLTDNVLPHLKDDECYPAFGGVLRIVETMRQNDFVPKNTTENFIFYRQKDLEKKEEEQRKQRDYPGKIFYQPYFLLILIPWLLFILIIILFVLWRTGYCVHWCCDKEKGYDTSITSSFDSPEHFYYPIDETPSISVDLEDEDVDSEPPYNHHEYEYDELLRQRGGEDFSPLFSYKVEDENNSFITLPLKRHRPNIETSSSGKRIVSPGKRLRKRLLD